jgi:hypothetical protein
VWKPLKDAFIGYVPNSLATIGTEIESLPETSSLTFLLGASVARKKVL